MADTVIPDDVIEAAARAAVEDATTPGAREWNKVAPWTRDIARSQARAALSAAAPLIVAANQPEPAPEWKCPSCGATTRARMADRG